MRLGTLSTTPAVAVQTYADPLPYSTTTNTGIDTSNLLVTPFSQMTAAQQAVWLDAQNASQTTGLAFSDMTSEQQAAFEAALGIGSDTPSTTDTSSLDTVAMYLGIGLFGIIVLSHLLEGGR